MGSQMNCILWGSMLELLQMAKIANLWHTGKTPAGGVKEDERTDNSQGMRESVLLRLV